jgi:hypothetical protein
LAVPIEDLQSIAGILAAGYLRCLRRKRYEDSLDNAVTSSLQPTCAAQYGQPRLAQDSVVRLFYVGVTRAREAHLCQQETDMATTI